MQTNEPLTLPESLSRNPADGIQNTPPSGLGDHWFETATALVRTHAKILQADADYLAKWNGGLDGMLEYISNPKSNQ